MEAQEPVRVRGALCLAVAQACVNLNFWIDEALQERLAQISPVDWCPLSLYRGLVDVVTNRYPDPAPIREQIGVEVIRFWYQSAADKSKIRNGVDFLHYQTSSEGYYSVVDGSSELIGDFALRAIDPEAGTAVVYSTTPFYKDLERGILRGGLEIGGQFVYIDVDNSADERIYQLEFH